MARPIARFLRIIKLFFLFFLITSVASVIIYRFILPPFTPLMVIRVFEQSFGEYNFRFKRDYVPLEQMSADMPKAVIAAEDQKFPNHFGFDLDAMGKAYKNNQKNKRSFKGGSTISQQVAKNVFLWPGRSYIRKGLEAYFTVLIEIFWSKHRILEVYLNVIEMGNGIYGTEAAARHYFKKSAKKLSMQECALIAAVLPNPRKWNPAKPTEYIRARQGWIIINMYRVSAIHE